MILRPAFLEDAENLAQLGRDSFCAAFAHLYRPEDLNAFLEQAYSLEAVADEIADPRYTHQLAQDANSDELAGYIKMRQPSAYTGHSDALKPVALCQLYTAPQRTGEGIGGAMMNWALTFARKHNHDAVQLSVWSENYGAQRFYQRYGFGKIADIHFMVGAHVDDEFLYELRL